MADLFSYSSFHRWGQAAKELALKYNNCTGDVLVSSGVVAYLGCFTSAFRFVSIHFSLVLDGKAGEVQRFLISFCFCSKHVLNLEKKETVIPSPNELNKCWSQQTVGQLDSLYKCCVSNSSHSFPFIYVDVTCYK